MSRPVDVLAASIRAVGVPAPVANYCAKAGITVQRECDDAWEFSAPEGYVFSTGAKCRVLVIEIPADWKDAPAALAKFGGAK